MNNLLTLLVGKGLTLGSVESLTAGMFASTFVSLPGASKCFKGGLITYASELKVQLAGVSQKDIDKYGVVSSPVAKEMAKGGLNVLKTDICVSCTGNAGPTACLGDAPVGQVFIAVAYKNNILCEDYLFSGNRNEIREQTILKMDELVIKLIRQY